MSAGNTDTLRRTGPRDYRSASSPSFSARGSYALAAAVTAHAAYRVYLASVIFAATSSESPSKRETARGAAALTSTVLEGGLRLATVAFAPAIERLTGAASRPGPGGTVLLFGGLAVAAAACRVVPAVSVGMAPSREKAGADSPGGIGGLLASEAVGVVGRTAMGLLIATAAASVSEGGAWRRWVLAALMAAAFAAVELAGAILSRAFERDLLLYEPGESVVPLDRPELVDRVKRLCDDMGMPGSASDVMVDTADVENLNAFAMYRVIVLSKRTATLKDVEHAAAIVAHELGHVRLKHVNKSVALNAAISATRFALIFSALLIPCIKSGAAWLDSAVGLTSLPRSVALLYFLARPVFDEVGTLSALAYSRASELKADEVGIEAVGAKKFLEMLDLLAAANPGTRGVYERLLAHRMTHPPAGLRRAAAERWLERKEIAGKWKAFTERWNGMFVRYLDGDPNNGTPSNAVCVSPEEAFAHLDDWVVNWPQCLTPAEIQFVLDNKKKFE